MRRLMQDVDDAGLLVAHVAGDPDAFSVLVSRHQDRLWAVALRTLRDPHDAADALQDAYLCAFRRAHTYRGEAKVSTWLHRIVINACLDRLRYQERRRTTVLDDNSLRRTTTDDAAVTDAVTEALAQISTDQRAALVLVDMEGFSVEEAAEMLGCAPGTVKSRCSRGRAKLAPLLRDLLTLS